MEVDVFLKSNIVDLQCEKDQIKGITSLTKENIIVYNDFEGTKWGFSGPSSIRF